MALNLAFKDLQKIILGKRTEPLSTVEVRNLLAYPTTPETVLYLIRAFNDKKLDTNITLVQAVANAEKKEDLVNIALSLRYGADYNLYVDAPSIGDIHIIGYTYLVLSKKDITLLNSVIIMLMVSGADSNLPIFDSKGGVIRDEFSLVEPIKGQSIISWLQDQGFDTIIPYIKDQDYSVVDKTLMTSIATYLDREDLLEKNPRLDEVIGAHAMVIFNKHFDKIDQNIGLNVAKRYLNLTAYEKFVDRGAELNYAQINETILSMEQYIQNNDFISYGQLREMFLYSVSTGMILDEYQTDLISSDSLKSKITQEYSKPYWVKICKKSRGSVNDKLKLLSYRLNINPELPKDTICNRLKKITQGDPEKMKQAAIERSQTKIRSDISFINEFVDGIPKLLCGNRSILKNNIYDFPDPDISYYRDDQNTLWCFTSNNFLKIIEQHKNPYTIQPFPVYFIDQVQRKMDFISLYRDIEDTPVSISETIDNLSKNDTISNVYTELYEKRFKERLILNGLTEWNIDQLTLEDMESILRDTFDISVNLKPLTEQPRKITVEIIV